MCNEVENSYEKYDTRGSSVANMISGHRKTTYIFPGYPVLTRINKNSPNI
jgi:hypothetical protein